MNGVRMACLGVRCLAMITAFLVSRSADASDKATCVAASEVAQQLRSEGKLIDARERLLTCARDACPAIVRKDCSEWLGEVDHSIASVVPGAKDRLGHDAVAASVFIDGRKVASQLDGRAITLDPGPHVVRFEAARGPSIEERIVVREGERNRLVSVVLESASSDKDESVRGVASSADTAKGSRAIPVASIALAGAGVLAFGSFVFFGVTGKADVATLRKTCAPECAQDAIDSARMKLVVADASLGVGVALLTVATLVYAVRGTPNDARATRRPDRPSVGVAPLSGGAMASLSGSF
jgi:hypothetical protein